MSYSDTAARYSNTQLHNAIYSDTRARHSTILRLTAIY